MFRPDHSRLRYQTLHIDAGKRKRYFILIRERGINNYQIAYFVIRLDGVFPEVMKVATKWRPGAK